MLPSLPEVIEPCDKKKDGAHLYGQAIALPCNEGHNGDGFLICEREYRGHLIHDERIENVSEKRYLDDGFENLEEGSSSKTTF